MDEYLNFGRKGMVVNNEVEETLEILSDKTLLQEAVKYFRLTLAQHGVREIDPEEMLDFIYVECARRGKEWIFDKAHEAAYKENTVCSVPESYVAAVNR